MFNTLPASFTEEQITDYIIDENVRRRQMSTGQLAAVAVELEQHYAELAKRRKAERERDEHGRLTSAPIRADRPALGEESRSREQAAKAVDTSGRSVQRFKTVKRAAPELAEQVRAGGLALDNAYRQARQREKAQPKPEPVTPGPTMLTLRTHDGTPVMYPQPSGKVQFNRTTGRSPAARRARVFVIFSVG